MYNKAKGQAGTLCCLGQELMEYRRGLVVDNGVTLAMAASGSAGAIAITEALPGQRRVSLGADPNDDTRDFLRGLRELSVTPPVAQHTPGRASTIDGQTPHHSGSAVHQRQRQYAEELVEWLKTLGLQCKPRYQGGAQMGWLFTFAAPVNKVVRSRTQAAVA